MKPEPTSFRPVAEAAVIKAKLAIPPLPERRVERPRVERKLATLIERHRTVVVSATPGAGKTTAVAAAVPLLELPVAWLTVDHSDSAPGRLVTYLEAALAQALPQVGGVATQALAAGIPHVEATGLLAEAVRGATVVFTLDELERLGHEGEAWAVIDALLRYAPAGMHTVLISRRRIPATLRALPPTDPSLASLGETELAFTPVEAARALDLLGESAVDAGAAIEATGGWVTGVLFEAWRPAEHLASAGGEVDPLYGYLSAHILGQLAEKDREFLVVTSILDEVTAERAAALGLSDAAERLAALHEERLPVTWGPGRSALRCHSRFREYLLDRLHRRTRDELRALRRAHGRLLVREGHDEEAIEELLHADAEEEALAPAERAIMGVVERLDFDVAERWLAALAAVPRGPASSLTTAELMLAFAQEDFRRAVRVADELAARGLREPVAQCSDLAAVTMVNCYVHVGRIDDARRVAAAVPPGDAADVLRYSMGALADGARPPRPEPTGGPLDAMIISTDYVNGRVARLVDEQRSGWVHAVAEPWRIGALAVAGHTQRALELYEEVRSHGIATAWLDSYFGPQALIDAGRGDEAREAIERGRRLARARGSLVLQFSNQLEEARFFLRLQGDPAAARAALDRMAAEPGVHAFPVMSEQLNMWYGLALLLQGDDKGGLTRLRAAVDSMRAGDRVLELPTAAVYLAEAEWRAGDEHAADSAADLALHAAGVQGSNHLLLRALVDFPAVVSRRIDAEPGADSPWHELGRALIAQDVAIDSRPRASVELQEFGRSRILVNGVETRPRIAKTYELLAYLSAKPDGAATREELLDALFQSRTDASARAYLRQAIRWLRRVLPDPAGLVAENGRISFVGEVSVSSESTRFEAELAQAARLQGNERRSATLEALAVHDRGEYLPEVRSVWAEERRRRLRQLAVDARYEAAELAFAAERYREAETLARQVLDSEPFRETAWRLTMRVASALGDEDGVIRSYQACEQALAQIGTVPASSTRRLLERLRR